tara:strand:+ start:331 stop:642 length:312 start_codon:yes stop_codon:yes gene_type:complete
MAKKKSKLKKIGAALAAGLGAAALMRGKDKGALTADRPRSMVPMKKRMVQGLNFPADTNLSGIDNMATMTDDGRSGVSQLKKGGRVGVGIAKRGFGRAMKGRK